MAPEYGEYGSGIAKAFQEYLRTGNEDLIEPYSAKQLHMAISKLSPYYDNNKQWYRTLEQRIEMLENREASRRQASRRHFQELREKWLDKVVFFLVGILIGGIFF